jgi:hypothetical protein
MLFLKDLFAAIAAIFGLASKRSDLNNSEEMKKRAAAQKEIEQDDKDDETISKRDLDATRNSLS